MCAGYWLPRRGILKPVSLINPLAQEISAKVVYYGPGLSGKTTSLKAVYAAVRPERRGELISLATEGDRTIFFDFLPLHVERVRGMAVRLQLYTVPGQVFYAATRKLVLNGADGVVFVADSQPSARQANIESFDSLRNNLSESGIDLELFPLVMQYNKRDLTDVMSVSQLTADLNWLGAPEFESSATQGNGVLGALKEIVRLVIRSLWAQHPKKRAAVVEERSEREGGLIDRISRVAELAAFPSEPPDPPVVEIVNGTSEAPPEGRVSFAPLWRGRDEAVITSVEASIAAGEHPKAVRLAAVAIADLLESLPGPRGEGQAAKVSLLGLDGREYLRLCRVAAAPEAAVTQEDALFALYVLVGVHLKVSSL